jgi:hypothetical protein
MFSADGFSLPRILIKTATPNKKKRNPVMGEVRLTGKLPNFSVTGKKMESKVRSVSRKYSRNFKKAYRVKRETMARTIPLTILLAVLYAPEINRKPYPAAKMAVATAIGIYSGKMLPRR